MEGNHHTLIRDEVSQQIINVTRELATSRGAECITVRDVLRELGITNRVFYNRFHNIEEVLDILYQEMIHIVRQSLAVKCGEQGDFFERVQEIATQTLLFSYEKKKRFSRFVFYADASSDANFDWWTNEIRKLISQGKNRGLLRQDLDEEILSYSIWCFIRGFNADALARDLSCEEALRRFNLGFSVFLEGMKV